MNVLGCTNVTLEGITISAPLECPNKDGIRIGRSKGMTINGAKIGTGNDFVSIGDGTKNLQVQNVGLTMALAWEVWEAFASKLHFEGITINNVMNSVVLDQAYCPYNHCTTKEASKVKLNNISFKRIKGTSGSAIALMLVCSNGFPCQTVQVEDNDLKYKGK
ncbi:hypothetical protein Ancab_023290 [Ancistrocladus abbreviatus]